MVYNLIKSQSIGAVNCIIRSPSDGKLFGFNTDYVGAISAIEDGLTGFICVLRTLFISELKVFVLKPRLNPSNLFRRYT